MFTFPRGAAPWGRGRKGPPRPEAALPYTVANDPAHWRNRAEEARAMAESLTSPEARRHMLNCAAAYERLAQLAEKNRLYEPPERSKAS